MPENRTIHAYRPEDLTGIVQLFNAAEAANGVEALMTPTLFQMFLTSPFLSVEQDTFVVESESRVVGYADCEFSAETGLGSVSGVVHPAYRQQGIGTLLIQRGEARILRRAHEKAPPEKVIVVYLRTLDTDQGAVRLFEAQGYRYDTSLYKMQIALDQPINVPPLPGDLVLRPFAPEHARAVYALHMEILPDDLTFEQWLEAKVEAPDVDTSLWQIAYDGDEIVGMALNRRYGDDVTAAIIYGVVVRPAWRRRGLGQALLRSSFAAFQSRGLRRAVLYVDNANVTNAAALYERAGMQVYQRTLVYRKTLRCAASEDDS